MSYLDKTIERLMRDLMFEGVKEGMGIPVDPSKSERWRKRLDALIAERDEANEEQRAALSRFEAKHAPKANWAPAFPASPGDMRCEHCGRYSRGARICTACVRLQEDTY